MNKENYDEFISEVAKEHIETALYNLYKAKLKNRNNDFIDRKIEIAIESLETINLAQRT